MLRKIKTGCLASRAIRLERGPLTLKARTRLQETVLHVSNALLGAWTEWPNEIAPVLWFFEGTIIHCGRVVVRTRKPVRWESDGGGWLVLS